jgi:hypothetical protein
MEVSISFVRNSMTMSLRRIALNWRHEETRRTRGVRADATAEGAGPASVTHATPIPTVER